MVHIKATILADIGQVIFSLCILLAVVLSFVFVPNILGFVAAVLVLFGIMSTLSVILSILELIRAKDALTRMEMSLQGSKKEVSTQIRKVILLSRPAPKFDEYLICALLYAPDGNRYVYPFPKPIDASAPIRKDIRKKLTEKALTLYCVGDRGVISNIRGFSLDGYPTTSYRPSILRRK